MADMTWTDTPPTRSGLYWLIDDLGESPDVVFVGCDDAGAMFVMYIGEGGEWELPSPGSRWAGPILPPEAPVADTASIVAHLTRPGATTGERDAARELVRLTALLEGHGVDAADVAADAVTAGLEYTVEVTLAQGGYTHTLRLPAKAGWATGK